MQLLDRYIAKSVGLSTLLVLTVLLTLFTLFAFMDEAGKIGQGKYGTVQALQYVLLTVPRLTYQLFPICVLLGATIGLGVLASNSELVAMRAAGVSLLQIIFSVMKVGLLFVVLTVVIGEGIAPAAERYAQTLRSVAMSNKLTLGGREGLWARDGNSYVNIRQILPGERLGKIFIYQHDDKHRLIKLVQAESAVYRDKQWVLQGMLSSDIDESGIISKQVAEMPWQTNLSPDLLNVVTVKPNTLSVLGLYEYVSYLKDNGLDAAIYEQALWGKIVAPLVTAVMMFLAIPFVLGPLRSVSVGHRILVGTLVGVGFYILNQMFSYMGIVFGFSPLISALIPTLLAFMAGYYMLRRLY